jgi:hypothetical protein
VTQAFEDSHLFQKLRKQVVVTRIFESKQETSSILYAVAPFDLKHIPVGMEQRPLSPSVVIQKEPWRLQNPPLEEVWLQRGILQSPRLLLNDERDGAAQLGCALDNPHIYAQVKADYEETREVITTKGFEALTGKMGKLVQPRTKSAKDSTSRGFTRGPCLLRTFCKWRLGPACPKLKAKKPTTRPTLKKPTACDAASTCPCRGAKNRP